MLLMWQVQFIVGVRVCVYEWVFLICNLSELLLVLLAAIQKIFRFELTLVSICIFNIKVSYSRLLR